ncbi:MAG: thermonuclease family protein [Candidatus Paceibacterota bacterium]|jgi:micrococcal nuclease
MQTKLRSNNRLIFILFFISAGFAGYYFFAALDPVLGPAGKDEEEKPLPYSVEEIIDGDTIKVEMGGKTETIRLIGIDTPEIASPYGEEECFGKEASEEAKKILEGQKVFLSADPMVSDKDKYGRLLRYVFLADGEFVNAELVKGGYAFNYPYENFQYLDNFNDLEKQAREDRSGLWGEGCDYYFETGR